MKVDYFTHTIPSRLADMKMLVEIRTSSVNISTLDS